MSVFLSVCLPTCLSLSLCMPVYLSACLSVRRKGPTPLCAGGGDRAENVFADRVARVVAPVEWDANDFI